MGNFIEDFFMGEEDPQTGETSGGLFRSFTETPFAQFWGGAFNSPVGQALTTPVRGATSGIMSGLEALEFIESYAIARPASTVLQSLSVSNPLYRNGIQLDDFVRMWNASEYISPGRAGITNIGSGIGMIETIARGGQDPFTGGADWNEFSYGSGYDPYAMDPEELEKQWDNSPLGTVGSTSLDTAFVIIAGGKGVNAAASAMKRAAGLSTSIKSQKDLTRLREQGEAGIVWKESGGTRGRETPFHRLITEVAETDDWATIRSSPLLDNWTRSGSFNADELATQWSKITDERLIMDMALADRGDVAAIGRLFNEAPDSVWSLMDMTEAMKRQFAQGGQYVPDAQTARIYNQTFESAVDRDEFWRSVKNTFMVTEPNAVRVTAQPGAGATITMQQGQETGGLISGVRMAGSDTAPIGTTGVAGVRDVAAYGERWIKRTMANARINRPNSWHEIPVGETGGRAPATKLLFWAGSRRPNNMIEFNSMRPTEIVDEMTSYSRSSRALRQREWTVTRLDADGIPQNVTMRDFEWRAEALARLGAAKSAGDQPLAATVRELEEELISVVANKYRVSPEEASRIAKGLSEKSDAYQAQVARDGFWIDGDGVRVVVDPVTKRQLANSMVLMPLDDLDWAIRQGSTTRFARRGRGTRKYVVQPTQYVLDNVYKLFRTNVLFRPGYIPKNSIGEPAVAALLADASLLPEGGLTQVAGRVGENTVARAKQFSYGITDRLPRSAARRDARALDELRDEYEFAVRQLEELELRIDDLNSSATPATRAKFLNVAERERRAAYAQLKEVERRMDVADPVWRDIDELPSYVELKDRVQLIDDAVNNPEFAARAQARIDEINASRSGGARDVALADDISSAQTRLDELQARRASLNEQKAKLAESGSALFAGRADVPVGVKRKDLADPDDLDARVAPDWIEQLARVNDPRKFKDRLRKSVPDAADRRRVEAIIRSIRYTDDQIAEQQRLLKNLEESRGSLRPLNDLDAAEMAELERLVALNARVAAGELDPEELLTGLRASLDEIRQASFRVEPNAVDRKMALEAQIAKLDGERRKLTDAVARRTLAREGARRRAFSGEEDITIRGMSGTDYRVSGIFSDEPGQFGSALRVDSSASTTALQTASGGARSGTRWRQSSSGETINPFDARYWDELAYIANRHVRGDDFAALFLQGKSQGEIIAWLKSPAGREYRKAMGWKQDDIYGEASVIVRTQERINQYFPNAAVRARLLEGDEVTPGQLQKLMGDTPIDELSPVYGTGLEFVGNPAAQVSRALDNASNLAWQNLAAKPESRFGRWPFMQREYRRQMERQIALAEQQGLTITGSTLQAMQRTARSRALKEMENTFYNIRRMAGPVYAMRYFMGFPAAAYNTAYRYGRLAYRSPGNALVQAMAWQSALEYFGVDEEGNRVENWKDIDNIVFSVPEEWNLPIDPKITVKAESLYLGAQEGSLLPTVTVPVSALMRYKPDLDKWLQDEMPELYETMFGYGTGTDPDFALGPIPLDPFMASYQRKAIRAVLGDVSDEDFARVAIQDWQYRMYQWAQDGQEGPRPKWEDSAQNARMYYGVGAAVSFLAFGSFNIRPEGQFYRDEWYRIRDKYPDDFPAAQREMLDLYGPEAWFLMRPTSKNRAGMPATAEGFELFNQYEDLLRVSRELNPQDPSVVSQLMFLDARAYDDGEFSQAIYDWQFNNSLPGENEPIAARWSPQELEDELKISESWAYYNDAVATRDALMLEYGYKNLRPDGDSDWLYQSWTQWYEEFQAAPENRLWVAERAGADRTRSIRIIAGIDEFLNDSKWMAGPGQSTTWQTIAQYREELENARIAYDTAEETADRSRIAEEWDSYVRYWFLPQAGNFSDYYDRFLAGRDINGSQLLDREFDIPRYPISIGVSDE